LQGGCLETKSQTRQQTLRTANSRGSAAQPASSQLPARSRSPLPRSRGQTRSNSPLPVSRSLTPPGKIRSSKSRSLTPPPREYRAAEASNNACAKARSSSPATMHNRSAQQQRRKDSHNKAAGQPSCVARNGHSKGASKIGLARKPLCKESAPASERKIDGNTAQLCLNNGKGQCVITGKAAQPELDPDFLSCATSPNDELWQVYQSPVKSETTANLTLEPANCVHGDSMWSYGDCWKAHDATRKFSRSLRTLAHRDTNLKSHR
jgi:hypothetical protein